MSVLEKPRHSARKSAFGTIFLRGEQGKNLVLNRRGFLAGLFQLPGIAIGVILLQNFI